LDNQAQLEDTSIEPKSNGFLSSYTGADSFIDRLIGGILFVFKYAIFGAAILAGGLSILVLTSRAMDWLETGQIQHSTESANMAASELVRVLADVFAVFVYGLMFGFPGGLLIGLLIAIGRFVHKVIKRMTAWER
jgi:hypothetical protein